MNRIAEDIKAAKEAFWRSVPVQEWLKDVPAEERLKGVSVEERLKDAAPEDVVEYLQEHSNDLDDKEITKLARLVEQLQKKKKKKKSS